MRIIIGLALFFSAAQCLAFTATITTDTVDINPGDNICADSNGQCSLRAAIMESNASANHNTIQLLRGLTYQLSIPNTSNTEADGDLDIFESVTIQNVDPNSPLTSFDQWPTIDANGIDRVIEIFGASSVVISGIRITGGNGLNSGQIEGGGIMVHNNVDGFSLLNSIIDNNTATVGAGLSLNATQSYIRDTDISGNDTDSTGAQVYGSGIYSNNGVLNILRTSIHHNGRLDGQTWCVGAVSVHESGNSVMIRDSTIADNGYTELDGCAHGVLINNASLYLNNTTIVGNSGRGFHFYDNPNDTEDYTLRMRSSILDNHNTNCSGNTGTINLGDAGNGFNMSSDNSCQFLMTAENGNLESVDLALHPGRSYINQETYFWYKEPMQSSLIIDNGSVHSQIDECADFDQITTGRLIDGDHDQVALCDSGAIEYSHDLIFYHGTD
ncbi:MAG: hypothetical protein R3E90_05875 [Marinicella sp.]|nr:hypothetical protein [Xanthomonadales bacterium]